MEIIYFIIPLFPLLIRFLFIGLVARELGELLPEEENDRTEIRSYILALAGFSFTALVALALLEPTLQRNIQYPIYYVFLSFIFYFFAQNLQGYKNKRWHDVISDALIETASLCLILTVVALLLVTNLNTVFVYSVTVLALSMWLLDFIIRLCIQIDYLENKEAKDGAR
ncbi:MAG: hypothetical protein KF749_17075 [Bacteroidetes bacterium]|nr:hypothetical protein [Bacteroidota bacterium]MCW5895741.1 hypothetical protein [Bacteroidota bacterium]